MNTALNEKTPDMFQHVEGPRKINLSTSDLTPLDHLALILGNIGAAEQMQRRAIQDTIAKASAETWERRAAALEFARPRPGDFTGSATPAELAERDQRLALEAEECRNHARILRGEPLV